jgi:Fic family protein
MDLATLIQRVDELKQEIAALRPIDWEQEQRILQKFRMDWNYHSNAIEGNTLTYGETRAFLLHGITAQGRPFRDYLDIKGHQEAIQYLEQFVQQQHLLTEADIRELHKVLLVEPYEMPAITPNGLPARRRIAVGQYKTASNSVQTSTGAMHFYATPEEAPALMGDLMKWYRAELQKGTLHPLVLAATFHYRFVSIHPFDDGNGRMARLLMNLFLMQSGYVPVIIPTTTKAEYLLALESADAGDLEPFIALIGQNLLHALELFLRGAKGEKIDTLADLDKRIALLQKQLEAQGQVTLEPKNIASQQILATNLIHPFFSELTKRLLQLEPLFDYLTDIITYEIAGPKVVKIEVGNLDEKLNYLVTALKSIEGIYQINFTYSFHDFMRQSDQSIKVLIDFTLEAHRVIADYTIAQLSIAESSIKNNLLISGYHTSYSPEEIDALIYPIVAEILRRTEQFGQPISSSM